jgi:acyl-coenzyme A synthetase/AMP-(fatty) acid ligase
LATELLRRAERTLPEMMRPTRVALLHDLPRLPSGKANSAQVMQALTRAVRAHDRKFYTQSQDDLIPLV